MFSLRESFQIFGKRNTDRIAEKKPALFCIEYDKKSGLTASNQVYDKFDDTEKHRPISAVIEEQTNEDERSSTDIQIEPVAKTATTAFKIENDDSEDEGKVYDLEELNDMLDMNAAADVSELKPPKLHIKVLIIDCSPINYIDTFGFKALKSVRF